jgi:hypothetical protein
VTIMPRLLGIRKLLMAGAPVRVLHFKMVIVPCAADQIPDPQQYCRQAIYHQSHDEDLKRAHPVRQSLKINRPCQVTQAAHCQTDCTGGNDVFRRISEARDGNQSGKKKRRDCRRVAQRCKPVKKWHAVRKQKPGRQNSRKQHAFGGTRANYAPQHK